MEKILYPLKHMWITCVPGQNKHKYCQALDDQGKSYPTTDMIYAPYTGKIIRKYPSECEIWFESVDKVEFADGTIDYATILFAHKDHYDELKENVVYKQGEVIYSEGTKANNKIGGAERHVHFECCKGKTTGSGWVKAPDGTWNLKNGESPKNCYFVPDDVEIIKTGGIDFKKLETRVGTPVERNEYVDQLEVIADILNARETPSTKGKRLGYINLGIYNIIGIAEADGYTWYEVEKDMWIAYNKDWEILLPKKESEIDILKKELEIEQKKNEELNKQLLELQDKMKQINELSKI